MNTQQSIPETARCLKAVMVTSRQVEDAIKALPLDGYDLADIAAAVLVKAKEINPRFQFDSGALREALEGVEDHVCPACASTNTGFGPVARDSETTSWRCGDCDHEWGRSL